MRSHRIPKFLTKPWKNEKAIKKIVTVKNDF